MFGLAPLYLRRSYRPLGLAFFALTATLSHADETLRYGVFENLGYPLNQLDEKGNIQGGLLKELGEKMALELQAPLQIVPLSRRRIEPSLVDGSVDIVCYHSPAWTSAPTAFEWSIATLPQIERTIALRGTGLSGKTPDDFRNQRVVLQAGYNYPSLQPLMDAKKLQRVDETKVSLMFKTLERGMVDRMVTSEAEIEGYFMSNPTARSKFEISTTPFSVVPTQCAVSSKSRHPVAAINKALTTLVKRGDIERLAKSYGMSMR